MESNSGAGNLFQGRNSLSAVSDPSGESRELSDGDELFFSAPDITIIGEPVTMGSLAAVIEQKYGKKVQMLCPLEITEGLLRRGDEAICGEEAMEEKLKTARIIVADPLYRPICPETAIFYEMPHIAFSGRIYLRNIFRNKERFVIMYINIMRMRKQSSSVYNCRKIT